MTQIVASALRPIRLTGAQSLRLGAVAAASQGQTLRQLGRRTATTYTATTKPTIPVRKTVPPAPYRRTATTSTTPSSGPSSSSTSSPTSSSSTAQKPTTSAYAENQANPVVTPPYSQPSGTGAIPEPGNNNTAAAAEPAFGNGIDWSSSFHGLSTGPFSPEIASVLMAPIPFDDVEIKPDGIIYLPEIKYRRILNTAFGPGGWGMAPRGDLGVGDKVVTREYALLVHGRYVQCCPRSENLDINLRIFEIHPLLSPWGRTRTKKGTFWRLTFSLLTPAAQIYSPGPR